MKFVPRDYQKPISEKIINEKSVFVIAACGAGKSASTLDALRNLIDGLEVFRVLLVSPKYVTEHTWPNEIKKWDNFKHLTFSVATGSAANRKRAIESESDITLINRENIPWIVKEYGKNWPFDMVVIDESSSFKSSSSQRFKALKKIRDKVDRWVLLTGTPAPNTPLELWSQVYLLDGGQRLGRAFSAFRNRFFESDYMGYKFTPRHGAENQINELIGDLSVVVERYDGLPDRVDLIENVALSDKTMGLYQSMVKDMLLEFDTSDITAVNAAVLAGKLQQISNGAIYDENGDIIHLHDHKLDALESIVEQCEGENILLAYHFKHDLQRIKERFPYGVDIKEKGAIDKWNKGEIKLLLAHPACLHPETLVLTENRGWVPIITVSKDERVHDGVEFVSHNGCSYSGYSPVIDVFGIKMTKNHKLLIDNEWVEARYVKDCERVRRKARYTHARNGRRACGVYEVLDNSKDPETKSDKTQPARSGMQDVRENKKPWYVGDPILPNLEGHVEQMHGRIGQKLRGSGYFSLRRMVERFSSFLQGYVPWIQGRFTNRQDRSGQRLLQKQLQMVNEFRATIEQAEQPENRVPRRSYASGRILQDDWHEPGQDHSEIEQRYERGRGVSGCDDVKVQTKQEKAHVYDLVDCGERNRFLIKNKLGEIFISHNSAGHGLNIQDGGNRIIWFSPTWSTELKLQFDARLYRQGQEKPVFIHTLVSEGTVDLDIVEAVKHKKGVQDMIIDGVKKWHNSRVSNS